MRSAPPVLLPCAVERRATEPCGDRRGGGDRRRGEAAATGDAALLLRATFGERRSLLPPKRRRPSPPHDRRRDDRRPAALPPPLHPRRHLLRTIFSTRQQEDELTIVDVRKLKAIHKHKFPYEINEIAWNKTGDLFFITTGLGYVEVLGYPFSPDVACKLNAHTAGCYCIAMDPLDRYFAVGSADSLVSLWNVKELICIRTFTKLEWPVRTVSFNHTGELIAYASEDPFIDIANVQTGRSIHQIPCKAAMNSVEWNPKYNLLAYAGDDKNKYQADEGVFRIFGFEST